jgi:hypothetical protein
MIIRSEQIELTSHASRRRFALEATKYLASHQPQGRITGDPSALGAFVEQGMQKAALLKIAREVDVVRFLEVLLITGLRFENSARFRWVGDYLRQPMPAEQCLDHIVERLRFE